MWHGDHHYGSGDNQWSAFNHEAIVSCTPQKLSDRNPGTDPTRVRLLCPNTCGMAIIITEVAIISGLLLIMKRLSPVRLKNSLHSTKEPNEKTAVLLRRLDANRRSIERTDTSDVDGQIGINHVDAATGCC